jgi:hypothetical protein
MTCTECGASILIIGTRMASLLNHMVNKGEITVGEAREALNDVTLDAQSRELLAGWVLDRAEQGDHWKAGDQETLPCGCVVSYDRTQVGSRCETDRCVLSSFVLDTSETF